MIRMWEFGILGYESTDTTRQTSDQRGVDVDQRCSQKLLRAIILRSARGVPIICVLKITTVISILSRIYIPKHSVVTLHGGLSFDFLKSFDEQGK